MHFSEFFKAVASQWLALMSGIFSLWMSFREKFLGKNIEKGTFLLLAIVAVFLAFYNSWGEQFEKRAKAEAEAKDYQWLANIKQETINRITKSAPQPMPVAVPAQKTGNENTFMGNVPPGNYGDGNTIVGATDNRGNTILNQPMAVGKNAHAGPGGIAIGANAGASGTNSEPASHENKINSN